MNQEKVLVVIGDATETVDTLYPYFRLQEADFEPVVAGPEARLFQMVLHEIRPGWTITREWEGYQLKADIAFRDIDPADYAGIFFSGGRAPEYIRDDPDLIRVTQHFFDNDLPIASVCHGVEIPARADRVRGRRMACVPKCRFDLEVCGGIFVNEPCVIDGNLFSGRTFHDHGHYIGPWIRRLEEDRQKRREASGLAAE
ncbi:MAG: DJ-1/PfpI family protein [Bauldia sp.]|nr:DJ-1/PfpI family protein [Bauldia sp.]